jgi:hypothetical protein
MTTAKSDKETITISKEEYDDLVRDSAFLRCLEAAGVDNWDGISEAHRILEEEEE